MIVVTMKRQPITSGPDDIEFTEMILRMAVQGGLLKADQLDRALEINRSMNSVTLDTDSGEMIVEYAEGHEHEKQ